MVGYSYTVARRDKDGHLKYSFGMFPTQEAAIEWADVYQENVPEPKGQDVGDYFEVIKYSDLIEEMTGKE